MLPNPAKEKLLAGNPAYGYALAFGSPLAAEALAATGIDFVMIDTQHGSFGPDSVIASLIAITAGGSVPMARVARNDYTLIARLLDDGALGIVVPMVDTAADAKRAADACRLPPAGARSWGWGRAARYGPDYADQADNAIFLAVQIESITAVENAEAILATPGVDGCWMGPSDLALSMGIHPRDMFSDDRHARAIERVLTACANTGKIPGFAANDPADALARAAQGFHFLTAGSDVGFMLTAAESGIKTLGLTTA